MWTDFTFVPFDSTQRSVPPPALYVRAVIGVGRTVRFARALRDQSITDVIVMTANGGSAVEKTVMLAISRASGLRTAFYPVAYRIFEDVGRSLLWRWCIQHTIRLSTLVICQGATIAHEVQRLGATEDQCRIVPNLAELAEMYGDIKEEARSNEIVFLGWITASKGIFDLLKAIHLSDELATVPILICSDGPDRQAARAMASRLRLTNVQFLGWLETGGVREILQRASTLVLPSYTEGMPGSIVEALAAGAVVVTTPVGVITDYILHEESGLIVPVGDPAALAEALERIQRDPALRLRLRTRGQSLARAAFDADQASGHLSAALHHMGTRIR